MLQHLRNPKNTGSGVSTDLYFAPVKSFQQNGIASASGGNLVEILNQHAFRIPFGFYIIQCAPWKSKLAFDMLGEPGSLKLDLKLDVVVTGSYAELHEFMAEAINTPGVVLIRDTEDATIRYQFGNAFSYAYITATPFETGTEKDGQKSYKLTINWPSRKMQIYLAPIQLDLTNTPLLFGSTPLLINGSTLLIN